MKYLALLFLLAFVLNGVQAEDIPEEDDVLVLDEKNFNSTIEKYPFILVEFYAPWCGHCKSLAPEYSKAAAELKQADPMVPLAKVDATVNKQLADEQSVKGFPTLKFFIKGEAIDYTGGRTKDTIVQWIKKKTGPTSQLINTKEEADKIIEESKVILFFFGNDETQPEYDVHVKIAAQFEDVIFAHTFNEELKQHYHSAGGFVIFKKFDEGRNNFEGEVNFENLKKFVDEKMFATIMDFDQQSAQKIFGENKACLFLFVEPEHSSESKALLEASETLKGKILLSQTSIKSGLGQRLGEYIGVKSEDLPTVRIVWPTEEEVLKYTLKEEITKENILQFYQDWKDNKLEVTLKSAEIPENSYEDDVRIVVGKNFEEVVFDKTKDVLVEFYAPWCGHCKQLAPIYSELAKKMKDKSNLVIAKMDSTENEVKGVSIQGFPTLKFFPANKKDTPIDYSGERKLEDILKFVEENSSDAKPKEDKKEEEKEEKETIKEKEEKEEKEEKKTDL